MQKISLEEVFLSAYKSLAHFDGLYEKSLGLAKLQYANALIS